MARGSEPIRQREESASARKPRRPYVAPRFDRTNVAKQVLGKGKGSLFDTFDKLKSPPKQ